MQIDFDTRDARRTIEAIKRMPESMKGHILAALQASAYAVAARTRVLLKGKSPSKPSQPPGLKTGALSRDIQFKRSVSKRGKDQLAYIVFHSRDTFYGRFLELGVKPRTTYVRAFIFKDPSRIGRGPGGRVRRVGRGSSRGGIDPRPFLSRARAELRSAELARLQAAIERTLEEAARA